MCGMLQEIKEQIEQRYPGITERHPVFLNLYARLVQIFLQALQVKLPETNDDNIHQKTGSEPDAADT